MLGESDFFRQSVYGFVAVCKTVTADGSPIRYVVRGEKQDWEIRSKGAEEWTREFSSYEEMIGEVESIAPFRQNEWRFDNGGLYSGSPFGDGRSR